MSNDYFEFRRFTVHHELCAMKVGTDGVLLGAWAHGGRRVLDVGTGSGLIALCMAQRYPGAHVTAIDIDPGACRQAAVNAAASPFGDRISVHETALQNMEEGMYDSIVCNPPFFKDSLECPDRRRTLARHASALPARDLFRNAARLLTDDGELSVIIPQTCRDDFDSEALFAGMYPSRACLIRTVSRKPVSRCLLAYCRQAVGTVEETQECLNDDGGKRSAWYSALTAPFYLNNL